MNVVGNIPMKMIKILLTVQFFACCSLVYATLPMDDDVSTMAQYDVGD